MHISRTGQLVVDNLEHKLHILRFCLPDDITGQPPLLLVRAPFCHLFTMLLVLASSTPAHTSFRTQRCLYLPRAMSYHAYAMPSNPAYPAETSPAPAPLELSTSRLSALQGMRVPFWSHWSLGGPSASLVWETQNSFSRVLIGSWSLLLLPYSYTAETARQTQPSLKCSS